MKLSLNTDICDMLGIEYPIFGFNHCKDETAAICNAGGIGILGLSGMTADAKRDDVEWLKKHTDKPFGLDLLLPQSSAETGTREELLAKVPRENMEYMEKLKQQLGLPKDYVPRQIRGGINPRVGGTLASQRQEVEQICDFKPAIFAGGLGMNADIVAKCHKVGIKVVGLVGNVRQARQVAQLGVDIIVAQGTEAGGHTGRIGTMVLTPLVVDAVKPIPVLAAGGIADGRGLVAALALGASGVWTGTVWLTAHENPLEDFLKDRIIAATEEDAVISRAVSGKPMRGTKNKYIEYWERPGAPKLMKAPYQALCNPLPWMVSSEDADRTWEKLGLQDWIGTPAGQAVGLLKQRKSARQIILDMVSQAVDIIGE